jgi:hypothetical protein
LKNKYERWYDSLMAKAKVRRPLSREYYEKHHIVPKALGGNNALINIVKLTYREHFLAHWLLTKFTTGIARRKMFYAFARITGNAPRAGRVSSSWQYATAKRAAKVLTAERCSDPGFLEALAKRRLLAAVACASPKARANNSTAQKLLWQNEEYRARKCASYREGNRRSSLAQESRRSESKRKKLSDIAKAQWADPIKRDRILSAIRRRSKM